MLPALYFLIALFFACVANAVIAFFYEEIDDDGGGFGPFVMLLASILCVLWPVTIPIAFAIGIGFALRNLRGVMKFLAELRGDAK